MFEKIKEHVIKNQDFYILGSVAALSAGITTYIMRGRYEALANGGAYGSKTIDTSITMRPLSFLSAQKNVVNVISRNGRGHPGYIIHSFDTNEYFSSQRSAASSFNISETLLSKHLNGLLPNVDGYQFERLGLIAQ